MRNRSERERPVARSGHRIKPSPAADVPAADGGLRGRKRLLGFLLLLLGLWGLNFLLAAWLQGSFDTYRDLWHAVATSQGVQTGGLGPRIHGIFHLGPAWYHVLALAGPWFGWERGMLLLVALGAALPAPLALVMGWNVGRPRVGLAGAALLAIPGWGVAGPMLATHTSWVMAGQLLLALATIRVLRRADGIAAAAFALAGTLMLHAHPTTATFAAAALGCVAWRRGWRAAVLPAAALAACVALALLPSWLSAGGARDLAGIAGWAGELGERSRLFVRWIGVMAAVPAAGGRTALISAGMSPAGALALAWAPWLVVLALLASGRFAIGAAWRAPACLMALFSLQAFLLVLARDVTPPWMAFSLVPPLLVAAAWAIGEAPIARRALVPGLAVLASLAAGTWMVILSGVASSTHEVHYVQHREGSAGAMSIESPIVGQGRVRIAPYRLSEFQAMLPVRCEPRSLHGMSAMLADRSLGYPWLAACGRQDRVILGGRAESGVEQHFGFWDPVVARACAGAPERLLDFPRDSFDVLNELPGLAMPDARRYPSRDLDEPRALMHERRLSVARRFLAVVALSHYHFPLARVGVGGGNDELVRTDGAGFTLIECPRCSPDRTSMLTLRIHAAPQHVDIVAFDCPAGEPRQAPHPSPSDRR